MADFSLYASQDAAVNKTKNYSYGSSDIYESFTDNKGLLYKDLMREYGRCSGSMYRDTKVSNHPIKVGWVFEKITTYDDSNDKYLQETWVEII